MRFRIIQAALLIGMTSLFACKKEYIERVPVVTVRFAGIPTTATIDMLSFVSQGVGVAASRSSNIIHHTTDGGANWRSIPVGNTNDCRGICFTSADTGWVAAGNQLHVTHDGGDTWRVLGEASFVFRLKSGMIVYGRRNTFAQNTTLFRSADNGASFQQIQGTFPMGDGEACGDRIMVYPGSSSYGRYVDPMTGEAELFYRDRKLNGAYFEGSCGNEVGNSGMLTEGCLDDWFSKKNVHHENHLLAVDGAPGRYRYAVGENSIMTNMVVDDNGAWSPLFNERGEGFRGMFHAVQVLADGSFIVGGANGLILKCHP